ncbi:hypothetical protein [Mucilaginibacter psychrotolerans]|uniref:Uncharacterized protein n=1 Tax=Mucilaginibacter psychrotolerans TaxID=1524096 RepID=A0A4Y8SC57_9SPHI|nr:hypothetical protein [Mucilaginibacter psychrotolerans]TFF36170.1 hypothetical protein E2R66_16640 [Mucilaginibacter psychrotolerans]
MDNKNDHEPLLPPQFSHLENDLREAQAQLDDIDAWMEGIPKDKGLKPDYNLTDYNPPGTSKPTPDRAGMVKQLEDRKTVIRQGFNEKLEKNLVNTDPKTAKNVREAVEINLSDSKFRKMDRGQVKEQQTGTKSPQLSEDFMNKTLANYRVAKANPAPAQDASKNVDPKNLPASDRFMQSLNYTKELDQADASPDKTPDKSDAPVPEMDDTDLDKD